MKNMLLLVAVLLVCSCAGNPPAPESSPLHPSRLPNVLTAPALPAMTEGHLSSSLQDGWRATLHDLRLQLQQSLEAATIDLQQSLERARRSPPMPAPAGLGG